MGWGRFFGGSRASSWRSSSRSTPNNSSTNVTFSYRPCWSSWFGWPGWFGSSWSPHRRYYQHEHYYNRPNTYYSSYYNTGPRDYPVRDRYFLAVILDRISIGLMIWFSLFFLSYIIAPLDSEVGLVLGTIVAVIMPFALVKTTYVDDW